MKFTTTIKRKYLDMKNADIEKDGYFYEYKENTGHWHKRLWKLKMLLDGGLPCLDAVFLCGQEVTRFESNTYRVLSRGRKTLDS